MRPTLVTVIAVILAAPLLMAQASPAAFDVASVKQNNTENPSRISGPTPGRFTITNTPLRFVVLYAFELLDHQLIGAPNWTFDVRFDITATYPPGTAPTEENVRAMLQKLLADRFGLVVHRDTRQLSMYALVLARKDGSLGPRLAPSTVECDKTLADDRPQVAAGRASLVSPRGVRPECRMVVTRQYLTAGTRTIQHLGVSLQSIVARPVVDRTGLTGTFDMDLQWGGDVGGPSVENGSTSADTASIFTAVQEQLGLRLEATRGPFDVVVVDSVHQPTPD